MLDETSKPEPVGVRKRNEHQPHAKRPRRPTVQGPIKATREAMSCASCSRLSGLPDARRSRCCTKGQAERKLPTWCEDEGNHRPLEHQIATIRAVRREIEGRHEPLTLTKRIFPALTSLQVLLLADRSGHCLPFFDGLA